MEEYKVDQWLGKALEREFGFDSLLPVQKEVIPTVCKSLESGFNLDVCLSAPTGSGKTFCYLLPMIQHIYNLRTKEKFGRHIFGIVLVPSRELGKQVLRIAEKLVEGTPLAVAPLIDGSDDNALVNLVQLPAPRCGGGEEDGAAIMGGLGGYPSITKAFPKAEIVVATPQRLLKYISKEDRANLGHLQMLVIDEADEVLSGSVTTFASKVIAHYESHRPKGAVLHKMLCSATMTTHIAKVSEVGLQNPVFFTLDNLANKTSEQTVDHKFTMPVRLFEHWLTVGDDSHRHVIFLRLLRHLIRKHESDTDSASSAILVFCATNESVRTLGHFLAAAGIRTLEFTSAISDAERKRAILEAFVGASTSIVLSTDALMRGIDMPGVGSVVMYDAPRSLQQYIHRTGRTARANQTGHAYLLLSRLGISGTKEDGEISAFKRFAPHLNRTNDVIHERQLQAISEEDVQEAANLLAASKSRGGQKKKSTMTGGSEKKTADKEEQLADVKEEEAEARNESSSSNRDTKKEEEGEEVDTKRKKRTRESEAAESA